MAETTTGGPGSYGEIRGTADMPHATDTNMPAQAPATPFTPPDTSSMGYGAHAGGTAGPKGNSGGQLASLISTGGKLIELLPEAAA